jgi:hypothetical protein
MKTADLISALAAETRPVEPAPVMGMLAAASLLGAIATGLVLMIWLGLRPLGDAVQTAAWPGQGADWDGSRRSRSLRCW